MGTLVFFINEGVFVGGVIKGFAKMYFVLLSLTGFAEAFAETRAGPNHRLKTHAADSEFIYSQVHQQIKKY